MMFPMLLGGAALGALLNKKKPLQGALLGGALGGAGSLIGGGAGLLGNPMTAASYGTGLGTEQTAMLAAQEAGMGSMPIAGSMMGNLNTATNALKPFGQAFNSAQQVAGMFPEDQPPPPPQLMQQQGAGILAQLANQPMPQDPMQMEREMRRKQRRGLM